VNGVCNCQYSADERLYEDYGGKLGFGRKQFKVYILYYTSVFVWRA
jgi:hypothetical protein